MLKSAFDDGAVVTATGLLLLTGSTDTLPDHRRHDHYRERLYGEFDVGSQNLPSNATLIVDGTLTTRRISARKRGGYHCLFNRRADRTQ